MKSVSMLGMRPFDSAGELLDATYYLVPDGTRVALIMESRGGSSRDGQPGRNPDYNDALEVLMQRLGRLGAIMCDALVDSAKTQRERTPEEDRKLITGPVRLAEVPDIRELRLAMGRMQQRVAQDPNVAGGNATKRIRLVLEVPDYSPDHAERLADILAVPAHELSAPRAILERLRPFADSAPTDDEFARALAALRETDRAAQTFQRLEQSYLRRALFRDRTAKCDLCGRSFEVEFLVAAHIKRRSECTDVERQDVPSIVMAACKFGCDELYERGYVTVAEDGKIILSNLVESSEHASAYARGHLAGRLFGRPMSERETYFEWHRENRFREPD